MADAAEIDVAYVANLARLELTAEERLLFQEQLEKILGYIEQLKLVDVSAAELAKKLPAENVLRKDEPRAGLSSEEALRNAPRSARNLFIVPKVIE